MGDCNEGQCSTDKGSCESGGSSNDGSSLAEDLLCLATQAKHELLKEKIKKELEAKIGKKLDAVAKVVAEATVACLQQKMAAKDACNDYQSKLYAALKG